jgi:Fe-S cluster biosynthesis and repair protein YggX
MKKVIKFIIGVSLSFGLSSLAYATGETGTTATTCYAISDDVKEIYLFNPDPTHVQEATIISTSAIRGNSKGKYNGEASAFNSETNELYLFNNPLLGTTDDDNKFDFYAVDISDTSNPTQKIIKKDFLNFEPTGADYYNEKLYLIKEESNSTLYIYNSKTWEVESTLNIEHEISGFAIDAKTGDAYVMDDRDKYPNKAAELFKLDLTTGLLTLVSVLENNDFDAESLSFGADGKLYTENERKEEKRSIYEISTEDASVTLVAYLPGENNISKNDIESIACTATGGDALIKPTTDDKINPNMLNSLSAVNILNLSGKDSKGSAIEQFIVLSVPTKNQGTLYMEDASTVVEINQTLTLVEANGLKFDPNENFEGNVTFIYVSVDTNGLIGNEATVTIPLFSGKIPTTDNKNNESILNTSDAVDIVNLSGKDTEGNVIEQFIVTSLPSADAGVLYMADGRTAVTANQTITLEEADGLKFDPKAGFVGEAIFNYASLDNKNLRGNEATVTIPVKAEGLHPIPTTDAKLNPEVVNTMGAINIVNLSGSDAEGNDIQWFVITSLPSADAGVLYLADGTTAVSINQELTLEEANGLRFDPKEGYVGNAVFNYASIDKEGLHGQEASVTLPVVNENEGDNVPTTDNKNNESILNTSDAVDIVNLSGKDTEGNVIEQFIVTSLPSADAGVLYMADGRTAVTANQTITLEEADGLKFDPKAGFVGEAIFNYASLDNKNLRGNEATVTIPVKAEGLHPIPTTDAKLNPEVVNTMGAINIVNLSGSDAEGNDIQWFVITSLPSADAGVLYLADGTTAVSINQELTLEEANGLRFDPKEGYVGNAVFNYASIDKEGLHGQEASVTLPVVNEGAIDIVKPTADNRVNVEILNTLGAVDIIDLSGTDAEGKSIQHFMITSLPSADAGVLYLADGTTAVSINQELTLEEANGLQFDPKEGFIGDAVFHYASVDGHSIQGEDATVTIPVIESTIETDCECEDYDESIPVLGGLTSIFMLLLSSLVGILFIRKED